jgi:hypothetical protein
MFFSLTHLLFAMHALFLLCTKAAVLGVAQLVRVHTLVWDGGWESHLICMSTVGMSVNI